MVLGSADYRCSFFRFKLFVLHEYRLLKDNKLLCADRPPDDRYMGCSLRHLCNILLCCFLRCLWKKKHGWSARRAGLYLNLEQLWKTIALAVIVIVVSFGLVFAAHYFFQVDYRMYVVAFKTFGADKVLIALRYLPFFLLFYVMNSISANCFNYNTIGGKMATS